MTLFEFLTIAIPIAYAYCMQKWLIDSTNPKVHFWSGVAILACCLLVWGFSEGADCDIVKYKKAQPGGGVDGACGVADAARGMLKLAGIAMITASVFLLKGPDRWWLQLLGALASTALCGGIAIAVGKWHFRRFLKQVERSKRASEEG